jgi:hypothetical protein
MCSSATSMRKMQTVVDELLRAGQDVAVALQKYRAGVFADGPDLVQEGDAVEFRRDRLDGGEDDGRTVAG